MDNVLIYGGTFDPIHLGHLNILNFIQEKYHFNLVKLIPCRIPLLKDPAKALEKDRINMLSLIIHSIENAEIDLCEINRDTPSYMVNTLMDLKSKTSHPTSFTLLLGADAFAKLPQWHQWQRLLSLCHLLLIERPNTPRLSSQLTRLIQIHETHVFNRLKSESHGRIFRCNAGHFPITSSDIRKKIAAKESCRDLLPEAVWHYIMKHGLYLINPQSSTSLE